MGVEGSKRSISKTITETLYIIGVEPRRQVARLCVVVAAVGGAIGFVDVAQVCPDPDPPADFLEVGIEVFEPTDKIHEEFSTRVRKAACLRETQIRARENEISKTAHVFGRDITGILRMLQDVVVERDLPVPGIPDK